MLAAACWTRYYYNEVQGKDKHVREVYRDDPSLAHDERGAFFDFTEEFCDKYDQASFDASYSSMDIAEFVPMVERVFSRDAYWHTPDHPKRGAVTG